MLHSMKVVFTFLLVICQFFVWVKGTKFFPYVSISILVRYSYSSSFCVPFIVLTVGTTQLNKL